MQYPRLVALGVMMSGSVEVGHDLAQETMLRAYDRWSEVADYERLDGWLRRVMSNLLIDRHRSKRSEATAVARSERWLAVATEPEVSRWAELVADLPPRQRVVVTLFYAEDLSVDDIATTLDMAEGTVKSALWKARQRLSVELASEVDDG